ncbi:hypothetical protein TIFTF001_048338 [Ficus carica]|uniref:Uncharacterized protein n=1 Tax=Ficus carica TaxID=3494 RepID=A0AA87ZVP2_FICCA|nr:hypothetical protein TIFTF001_048320 [Ficus carica]GMN34182.1 hypothetical protein TIFTF001_048328 [Ficus carica]GMN34219.1 hypothetical protein TIFTF001_048330 [Ficus carica]GMN34228.1 hypothetical protein TIFTF001_048338 [Ficus carica]
MQYWRSWQVGGLAKALAVSAELAVLVAKPASLGSEASGLAAESVGLAAAIVMEAAGLVVLGSCRGGGKSGGGHCIFGGVGE